MDDVDRLFQCFKCGVSPPQSAIRHRKKGKFSVNSDDLVQEAAVSSHIPSSSPAGQGGGNSTVTRLSICKPSPPTVKATKLSNKQFSPIVFYGSPNGVPPKRPSRLLRLLREIHTDLAEQNKLRQEIWATFPKQDEAIKYVKKFTNARVFSYQDHVNGQRRFLASTYKEFWKRYKHMNPKFRHHYEVIQEGLPCHLYFDLEFSKKENAGKNGDEMVDLLLSVVFDALHEKYSVEADHYCVVELDSSTNEKFSCHLIVRLPKVAFKDNSHAGAFVAELCSRINTSKETDGRFKNLFVSKESKSDGRECQLFVDTAVYSRNRCFRLPLSSKAGKTSALLPSGRFKCKDMSEEDMFMASLICSMDLDCEKLLICKMDLDCMKALHFDSENTGNLQKNYSFVPEFDLDACSNDVSKTYLMGKSPFPALDMFIESVASVGNVAGKIRSWYCFSEYGLMVYSMSRNRYCERIGRQHKSNHGSLAHELGFSVAHFQNHQSFLSSSHCFLSSEEIYYVNCINSFALKMRMRVDSVIYVVDIRNGVYYQKCHDPDCRGYRSPLRLMPDNVLPDPSIFLNMSAHNEVQSHSISSSDENMTASCKIEEWWTEATRIADQVESIQKTLDMTIMMKQDVSLEEDDDWWKAVEITVSQTELSYSGPAL